MAGPLLVRNPRQSSTIFGLDGGSAPRQKNLFYVKFRRNGPVPDWQNGLGFVVKSIDRPSIQPAVEEINQYNKKRQITTGYKIQPMRAVLYDTADSLAMRMWADYTKWYYGDFSQTQQANWSSDVTAATFNDNGAGYGFQPRPSSSSPEVDINSQFFFYIIEIYQVFGGLYTQFDLINPRITAFDPDNMDYADSEVATISMTFTYEAIIYRNDGKPQPIDNNQDVAEAFDGPFDGDTFDVPGAAQRMIPVPSLSTLVIQPLKDFRSTVLSAVTSLATNSGFTVGGGALSQFGNFNFGSLAPGIGLGNGLAADVSLRASGNNTLSTLLNLPVGTPAVKNLEALALSSTPAPAASALSVGTLYAAQGALQAAGAATGNPFATNYINNNLIGGVAASGALSGSSPNDQIDSGDGLALNTQSYGIINAQRPAYSQIGLNTDPPVPVFDSTTSSNDVDPTFTGAPAYQGPPLSTLQSMQSDAQSQLTTSENNVQQGQAMVDDANSQIAAFSSPAASSAYIAANGLDAYNKQSQLLADNWSEATNFLNGSQGDLTNAKNALKVLNQQIATAQMTSSS